MHNQSYKYFNFSKKTFRFPFKISMSHVFTSSKNIDHYNSQSLKAGQRVLLTTYCPWATCFWAAAPKGTKSCRTQGDFSLSVCSFVHRATGIADHILPLGGWFRHQTSPLRLQISPLRLQISPLRLQFSILRSEISSLRPQQVA